MKTAIVALCIVASAFAVSDDQAEVLASSYDLTPEGNYQHGFETNNGIKEQASGVLKSYGKDEAALEVTGYSSFIAPSGEVFETRYVADANGYHPEGAHLPTPPPAQPIPEYIAKALDFIKAHPYVEKPGKY